MSIPTPSGYHHSRRNLLRAAGLGTAAAAGIPLLQSCGFGAAPGSEDGSAADDITGDFDWKAYSGETVKLLMNKHPYTDALKDNKKEFESKTGITLEIDEFPESNYFDKVTLELQSQQGNYDAFMLGAYMVWQYGPPGYLEDLQPWIDNASATHAEFEPDDIFPNMLAAGQWSFTNGDELGGDQQWMLPWGFETNVVCYRKDIFDKVGVKPAEDFDELVELAATLNDKAGDDMYGIAVRGSKEWATIHPGFMTMYTRLGLTDFDVDGETLVPRMNSADAVEFTDKWAKMVRDSGPDGWTSYTWYQASDDLGAGKAAMLFDADTASYFQNEGTKAAGNLAWHPGPKGKDGSLDTNLWIWSLAMNAASQKKEATWWFLQWAMSKEHLTHAAIEGQHIDTVRQSIADSGDYKDKLSEHTDFLDTFETVINDSQIQFTPQMNFFDATTSWAEALQSIYGGDDAQEILDDLASSLESRVNE